jgi:UDP-glucose 4-epimerase
MKVLVTGGCGFIGTNLVHHLGVSSVVVLDNLSNNTENRLPKMVKVIPGSITNKPICKAACKGVDAVVHLAAKTGVARSLEDPVGDCEENVIGTLNLLEAAKEQGVKRFIFASSGCVVGNQSPPFHELMIRLPASPYAASKAACEMYCQAYTESFGLETVVLRFSNVYGPHSDHKDFNLIPSLIIDAFTGEKTMIYGDGYQTRDYIFVGDLVQGIRQALHHTDMKHEIFQLGTGQPSNVFDVLRELEPALDKYGKRAWLQFTDERSGELKNNFVTFHKAYTVLKFEPKFDLKRGLEETVDWYAKNIFKNKK